MDYSKGPWEVKYIAGLGIPEVHNAERPIARGMFYMGSEDKEVIVNAQLISAAPDMYEALQRCMEVLEIVSGIGKSDAVDMATQALAKAEGRS